MRMGEKYRYLMRNMSFFTVSNFIPKLLAFVMVPIYTNYLTTAEYGVADLLITTVLLLLPIFTLDIQDAALRFAMDKHSDRIDVLSTCARIDLRGALILGVLLIAAALCGFEGVRGEYLLFLFAYFAAVAFYNSFSLFSRGIDLVRHAAAASIVCAVVALGSNIAAIFLRLGLPGYLAANALGYAAADVYFLVFARLWRYVRFAPVSSETARAMRRFSVPLILSVIAWWVNSVSDRYVVVLLRGAAACGVYSIAGKVPIILSTFQNVFSQAWSVSAIRDFDRDDRDGFVGNTYAMLVMAMSCACSFLMIFNVPLARLLYAKDFFAAWRYAPPLIVAVVFNALALFVGSIFIAVKDTRAHAVCMATGAAINTALNIALVSLWGAYGAGLSTLVSYAIVLFMSRMLLRRHIWMRDRLVRDLIAFALLVGQMAVASARADSYIYQPAFFVAMLALFHGEARSFAKAVFQVARRVGARRAENG